MGGVCSGGTTEKSIKLEKKTTPGFSGKLKSKKSFGKQKRITNCRSHSNGDGFDNTKQRHDSDDFRLQFSRELKPSTPSRTTKTTSKVPQKSSLLGLGFERAVDVLDTLGSSMSNLNAGNGFVTGLTSRGNRISILAFEVANTIAKGATLLESLSEHNIRILKKDVLHSEGVQKLVSTNMKELLSIAACDKMDELDVFSREVIRFGDLCKDPNWHNLGRYFSKLDTDNSLQKQTRTEAEMTMKELTTLAKLTSELYHELNILDRFDQDYRRKLEEMESLNLPKKGESIVLLQSELRQQKKLVRSLKKKSLWSITLEEIMEKLVDIVTYMHQTIFEAFGGTTPVLQETTENCQKLGVAGLSLHYANLIHQIDNIAGRPASLPPNIRDTLYHGLPPTVKTSLRSQLQSIDTKEEHSISQVKGEMEKTLKWLVPIATNTTKAHQGFGWVGEWANTGIEFGRSVVSYTNLTRLQTLYHADKQKIDAYILELVAQLHHLISLVKQRDHGFKPQPFRSPTYKGQAFHSNMKRFLSFHGNIKPQTTELSQEDRNILNKANARKLIPGISKSQEFPLGKNNGFKIWALSRSVGSSPVRSFRTNNVSNHPQSSILDVMDGLDLTS